MKYFALFYDVVDNFTEKRAPFRALHLSHVKEAVSRAGLLLAGALDHPPDGALLIFRSPDRTAAEEFARQDPYVVQGLVTRWTVRPWNQVITAHPGDQGLVEP